MVPYTLCMLLFDIAAYMLCMLSSCNWVEDCMVAMLDPAVEAARLPRVCPMTLGYRGLPRSSNDKNMHDTQKGTEETEKPYLREGACTLLLHVSTTQGWDDRCHNNCHKSAKDCKGRCLELRMTQQVSNMGIHWQLYIASTYIAAYNAHGSPGFDQI